MSPRVAGFLVAKALSDIGTALDFICLGVFIWVQTESGLATSFVGFAMYGGGVIGGRLAHRYGDRWDRRRVMIAADLVRMGVLLPLVVLPDAARLWWIYPALLLIGICQSAFSTTLSASVPVLAGDRTQGLNSVLSGLTGVSRILGMGLAAIAVTYVGYGGVFAVDAATYGLSALVMVVLRLKLRAEGDGPKDGPERGSTAARWAAIAGAGLAGLLIVRVLDAFGSSSHHVGLPMMGAEVTPDDPARFTGAIWMTWAIGVVVTSFALRPMMRSLIERAPTTIFYLGTALMSAGFIGIFALPDWPSRLAAAAIAGIGDALTQITFQQSFQRLPDDLRGSAFGLAGMWVNAGFLTGLLVTGLAISPERVTGWVLLLHGVPMLVALALCVTARRRAADRARVP